MTTVSHSDPIREGVRDAVRTIIAGDPPVDDHVALFHDLGIAGDDAWELIALLRDRFQIDATGFDFSQYFPGEGDVVPLWLLRLTGLHKRYRRLTLAHVIDVCRRGRWFELKSPNY